MPRSVALNTAYPTELLAQLRQAAASENVTVGALVRRAVRWELQRLQFADAEREPRRGPAPMREAVGRG